MKKIKQLFIGMMLVSAMFVTQVFATPTIDDLKDDKDQAEADLNAFKNELSGLVSEIANLEIELVETGREIEETKKKKLEAEAKQASQYDDMKLRIQAMYENGNASMIQQLFESESMADVLVQSEYIQAINEYDRKKLDEYVSNYHAIVAMKEALDEKQASLIAKQEEYVRRQSNLNTMIAEKEAEVDNFSDQIAEAVAAAEAERIRQQQLQQQQQQQASSNIDGNYEPPKNSGGGQAVVDEAYKYLGVPYVWGGASGSGVDCSGLVLLAHRAIGVSLYHYSGSIGSGGQRVPSMSQALPGDVVCYVGHVGIYLGNGMMIHAPQTGDVVRVVPVYGSPWFRRYW